MSDHEGNKTPTPPWDTRSHAADALAHVPIEHRRRGAAAGVGATAGAVLGSCLAGPIGAAVGAALGGVVGVTVTETLQTKRTK